MPTLIINGILLNIYNSVQGNPDTETVTTDHWLPNRWEGEGGQSGGVGGWGVVVVLLQWIINGNKTAINLTI